MGQETTASGILKLGDEAGQQVPLIFLSLWKVKPGAASMKSGAARQTRLVSGHEI